METRQREARVVNRNRRYLSRQIMFAALDKRLGHCRYFFDPAVQPHGRIDGVGEKIAGHATAGHRGVQAPQSFPSPCGKSLEIVQSCRNFAR